MGSDYKQNGDAEPGILNIAVVAVPLPAQGHLNPLLHLSSHIISRGIHVHYVGSAIHNRQARERYNSRNLAAAASYLHFHDLPFPIIPSPTPSHLVKFPCHLQPSFDAAGAHLLPHLSSLLLSLSHSHRRIVLIHDSSMSFANDAASSILNAEAFSFVPISAFSNLLFLRKEDPAGNSISFSLSDEFMDFVTRQQPMSSRVVGRLFNTSHCIEGAFLDQLDREPTMGGKRSFAIGPLNPITIDGRSEHECLRWLDTKAPASVLYVSFGTTSTMPGEQVRELAAGLEKSGQSFIWVRRDADRCDIFESGVEGKEDIDLLEFQKR